MLNYRKLCLALCAYISIIITSEALASTSKIGVVGAVNQSLTAMDFSRKSRLLNIGNNVFFNDIITTDTQGSAQLIFLDKSTLSISSNASLMIDKFIYDPSSSNGELVMRGTKGAFRFVGGALSKKNPVIFKTPVSTIGIRGGIALIEVDNQTGATNAIFAYGHEMTVTNLSGQVQKITQPGFSISVQTGSTPPSAPVKVEPQLLQKQLEKFESPEGKNGGSKQEVMNANVLTKINAKENMEPDNTTSEQRQIADTMVSERPGKENMNNNGRKHMSNIQPALTASLLSNDTTGTTPDHRINSVATKHINASSNSPMPDDRANNNPIASTATKAAGEANTSRVIATVTGENSNNENNNNNDISDTDNTTGANNSTNSTSNTNGSNSDSNSNDETLDNIIGGVVNTVTNTVDNSLSYLTTSGNIATGTSSDIIASTTTSASRCTACLYADWGVWAASVANPNNMDLSQATYRVTGQPTQNLGNINLPARATYSGVAVGTILNNLTGQKDFENGTFTSHINMANRKINDLSFNFAGREFGFSNKQYAIPGTGSATFGNMAVSALDSGTALSGTVNGALFGDAAENMGGNFTIDVTQGSAPLHAEGVYVGKR